MTGTTSISTVDESYQSEGGDTIQSPKTTGESFSASNSNSNLGRGSNSTADVSQFIFLNPIWLMTACKGILRHDLKGALKMIEGR
jgi:hypothetical protein